MRRTGNSIPALICLVFVVSAPILARGDSTITFEQYPLPANSYYNGSDGAGGFSTGGTLFTNSYHPDYHSWLGWSASNKKDSDTPGYQNQYSAYPGGGADGSNTYAVAFLGSGTYQPGGFTENHDGFISLPTGTEPLHVDIANTTYAAKSMQTGDLFAKRFGGNSGNDPDWFKLTVFGVNSLYNPVASTSLMLADYRGAAGTDFIRSGWTRVDLSSFRGKGVMGLTFELASTDNNEYGMNTPAYFALDNLALTSVSSPILGDANGDSRVGQRDLRILLSNLGLATGATVENGDFNEDGAVTIADLLVLQGNLGEGGPESAPAPSAVPEPSGALLAAIALAGLGIARKARQRPRFARG